MTDDEYIITDDEGRGRDRVRKDDRRSKSEGHSLSDVLGSLLEDLGGSKGRALMGELTDMMVRERELTEDFSAERIMDICRVSAYKARRAAMEEAEAQTMATRPVLLDIELTPAELQEVLAEMGDAVDEVNDGLTELILGVAGLDITARESDDRILDTEDWFHRGGYEGFGDPREARRWHGCGEMLLPLLTVRPLIMLDETRGAYTNIAAHRAMLGAVRRILEGREDGTDDEGC